MPPLSDYPTVDQQTPGISQYLPEDSFKSKAQKIPGKSRKKHEITGEQTNKEKAAKGQSKDV